MISCGIDLIMNITNYSKISSYIDAFSYVSILMWLLIIYNAVGLVCGFLAYKCFKNEFYQG
jgi:hypothetical protein